MPRKRKISPERAAAIAAYEFAVYEAQYATYGDARTAWLNRGSYLQDMDDGAPPQSIADMLYEVQLEHEAWLRDPEESTWLLGDR